MTPEMIANRISEYLALGGFFNPEAMEHDKVRDMLIDARNELTRLTRERAEAFNAGIEAAAKHVDGVVMPVTAGMIRALKKPATGQATGEK